MPPFISCHCHYCWCDVSLKSKYQGIPDAAEVPPTAGSAPSTQAANLPSQPQQMAQPAPVPSTGPNANPLDLFPQVNDLTLLLSIHFIMNFGWHPKNSFVIGSSKHGSKCWWCDQPRFSTQQSTSTVPTMSLTPLLLSHLKKKKKNGCKGKGVC